MYYSFPTFLLFALQLLVLFTPAQAQGAPNTNLFQWKFSNNYLSTSLPSCTPFPITVQPVNDTNITHGIPPFYMVAWELGGTPRTTLLGMNESSLSYTVDHPIGTQLVLNVVDSQGNGGGLPVSPYTVITSQWTDCIVSGNNTDFTVTANVTDTIETCQPWGLRIKGGAAPYNISIAQPGSPIVTNVTVQAPFDAFTYINRGDPNKLLIAAVSDVTGRYAFGTPTVMPRGSSNVACVGLNSMSGNATALDQQEEQEASAKSAHQRTAILAGVLVPLLVLLFIGLGLFFYIRHRRAHSNSGAGTTLDTSPKPFLVDESVSPATFDPYSPGEMSSTPRLTYGCSPHSTEFSGSPDVSARRSSKIPYPGPIITSSTHPNVYAESALSNASSRNIFDSSQSGQTSAALVNQCSGCSVSVVGSAVQSPTGEHEHIIQHRDGGGVVRELPPPYADRSAAS